MAGDGSDDDDDDDANPSVASVATGVDAYASASFPGNVLGQALGSSSFFSALGNRRGVNGETKPSSG